MLVGFTVLFLQSEASAQSAPPTDSAWRVGAGAGIGVHLSGHEMSDAGEPAGLAQIFLERRALRELWVGLGWTGAWLRGAPGGDSRQALLLTVSGRVAGSLELRVGGGLAVATVVEIDGPPDPPLFGDATVSVGSESGGAFTAGIGLGIPLASRLTLSPGADVLIHRVGGQTLSLLTLSARLRFDL
jgi:hypothetical protein